ncbi:glycosyltransferase family 2 protein [Rubrimonas cliftonensis]|uniref:Glycosyltransferase involved in cell wall bisynthesis n=1 Tax=Rubrimonas cliftonensis TaxID=89524 RepID=A0A1H4G8T9_9RHOB|nr:glycosyltransferase family 2 protein [Rubrimonas cliftonensis]SEB05278.1 Glycosyltransferase involved in cell wall bisynthesis [Rubrimonas cliftonensis]
MTGPETATDVLAAIEPDERLKAPAAARQGTALSICIPTCNRAPMLRSLLQSIARETAELGDQIEVIVSDNASEDDTTAVAAAAAAGGLGDRLRYFRQAENIGAMRSLEFTFQKARGRYCMYLADDDIVFWPAVLKSIRVLEANPNAVSLFAPWYLVDLVDEKIQAQFYHHSKTHVFSHENRAGMARFILENQVFSEIAIHRTALIRQIMPVQNDLAFWAFTMPAELLNFGEVIYSEEPFYGSVTRHPAAAHRSQAGHEEVMIAWDRYRGGVEHLIGLAGAVSEDERAELRRLADHLVQDRMLVALRLRLGQGRDAVESYFLASRLRGLGRADDLPLTIDCLSMRAGIGFLDGRVAAQFGASRLVLVGGFTEEEAAWISDFARIPVALHEPGAALGPADIALMPGMGAPEVAAADYANAGFRTTICDLMAKFP